MTNGYQTNDGRRDFRTLKVVIRFIENFAGVSSGVVSVAYELINEKTDSNRPGDGSRCKSGSLKLVEAADESRSCDSQSEVTGMVELRGKGENGRVSFN